MSIEKEISIEEYKDLAAIVLQMSANMNALGDALQADIDQMIPKVAELDPHQIIEDIELLATIRAKARYRTIDEIFDLVGKARISE